MPRLSDLDIANGATLMPMTQLAEFAGLPLNKVVPYGANKAKLDVDASNFRKRGKLILVTAITPTPAGEGKTTTSIGLSDGLKTIGKKVILTLREPSLGPVFGLKGGAAGGGYAQVVPMEDINLHFTGDFHAITAAHNLLAAMLDNHLHHGNQLGIDTRAILWKRVVDMNDRQLRYIIDGLNGANNGLPREDGFDITVASEIMAILCLANDLQDLKTRLKRIIVAYNTKGEPVTANDLKAAGAMAVLLKDAMKPNLVQTIENTPAIIHGGPFANIAHGCNSVIATKTALQYADYVVTEAGFGADLGAEKFINIKCRQSGLTPDATVLVVTVRALKMHGGVKKEDLNRPNLKAIKLGMDNLQRHLENIREVLGLKVLIAINEFPSDTIEEHDLIIEHCRQWNVQVYVTSAWANGGKGARTLAEAVVKLTDEAQAPVQWLYQDKDSVEEKINAIVKKYYRGKKVNFSAKAKQQLIKIKALNMDHLPICMAKTQYSFTDNAKRSGAPSGFEITIQELHISAGAGFIVATTGTIMTMPGLPKEPAAEKMDIDIEGNIQGLF